MESLRGSYNLRGIPVRAAVTIPGKFRHKISLLYIRLKFKNSRCLAEDIRRGLPEHFRRVIILQ